MRRLSVLIAGLVATVSVVCSGAAVQATPSGGNPPAELRAAAESFVREHEARVNRVLEQLDIRPQSVTWADTEVEAIYTVELVDRLGYQNPGEAPALKAKQAWLVRHARELTALQFGKAAEDIAFWQSELQGYIDTPADGAEQLKVVASLTRNDRVVPGSIHVLIEGYREYIPAQEFLDRLPTPDSITAAAASQMEQVVSESTPPVAAKLYNRIAARDYVNAWVRSTTKACPDGTIQDMNKYNPVFSKYACNDCANFVSQGLKAGGIPTDPAWYQDSPAWVNVVALKRYMTSKGYWARGNAGNTVAGYPITLGGYHVIMVVLNDTVTIRVSGHSKDQLKVNWWYDPNATYWNVSY